MVDGLTCDRCGGGHGPWDSYAAGRILLCSECRKNVPDAVRFGTGTTDAKKASAEQAGEDRG